MAMVVLEVLVEPEALEVAVLVAVVPLPMSSSAPTVETVVQPTACLTVLVARRRSGRFPENSLALLSFFSQCGRHREPVQHQHQVRMPRLR